MDSAVVGGFLQDASQTLKGWVDDHPIIGAIAYVLATGLGKLVPLPAGGLLILSGGYLFGTLLGGLLAALGGALSAGIALIVSRRLLTGFVERRLGERVEAIRWIIAEDAFNYILSIRLIPIMPAWLSNILPAPFDIPVRKAMLATFIGVLPAPAHRQPEPLMQDAAEQAGTGRHQGEAARLGEGTGQGIGEKPGRQQPQQLPGTGFQQGAQSCLHDGRLRGKG